MDDLRADEARILVALDFGTTFSGFAYALRAEPTKIYTFYEWPLQALSSSNPYCKTQTSLWYMPESSQPGCYELKDWGWPALLNYSEASQSVAASRAITNSTQMIKQLSLEAHKSSAGYLVKIFKLHLANTGVADCVEATTLTTLSLNFCAEKLAAFRQFAKENPAEKLIVSRNWAYYKHVFDGSSCLYSIDLPEKLAKAWKLSDCSPQLSSAYSYDEIDLSEKDMKDIFNPVVNQILALIAKAMPSDITVLMMVGGFSSSPYLMRRINEKFGHRVDRIFVSPYPGKAVCSGAITLAMSDTLIVSRVSRKTYGSCTSRQYSTDDPFEYKFVSNKGETLCKHCFLVFVRVDEVPNKHSVRREVCPVDDDQEEVTIKLYSSTKSHPKYTAETESTKEGSFSITFSSYLLVSRHA